MISFIFKRFKNSRVIPSMLQILQRKMEDERFYDFG